VAASGTTVIDILGVGPVVAATVVGVTGDVARFPNTRPLRRLQRHRAHRGVLGRPHGPAALAPRNRTLNHVIHMAAVTQRRFAHSPGRGYDDRKIADDKTPKEALRALKRRISDALWVAMVADARGAAAAPAASARKAGPGGQPGNDSVASAAGSHPETPAVRPSHSRTRTKATTTNTSQRRPTPRTPATARRTA
jgi:hypothetical protein